MCIKSLFRPFTQSLENDGTVRKGDGSGIRRFENDSFNGDMQPMQPVQNTTTANRSNTSKIASGKSMQVNLKDDIRLIESITVRGYEEIIRSDKKTMIYLIDYILKGQQFSTKRSYSEFINLRKDV